MTDNVTHLPGAKGPDADGDNRMTGERFNEIVDEYDALEGDIQEVRAKQKLLKDELKASGYRVQAFTHWRWRRAQADIASFDEMVRTLDDLHAQAELPL